jgi:CheY-like chemotaxis protein
MEIKRTILVLEDEKPLQEAIKAKLQNSGLEVITARSVEEAEAKLNDLKTVDAIWLDHYLLGRENGLDFVTKLKTDGSSHKQIPVFVVSNTANPDKVRSYIQLGVNKYYTKANYRLEQIIGDIQAFFDKKEE